MVPLHQFSVEMSISKISLESLPRIGTITSLHSMKNSYKRPFIPGRLLRLALYRPYNISQRRRPGRCQKVCVCVGGGGGGTQTRNVCSFSKEPI